MPLAHWDWVLRLLLAGGLGAVIGAEREAHYKDAGLRTHFVVCIGSALIMLVSKYGFNDIVNGQSVIVDPSRIAAQVVSGIGFLGAGLIIFRRNSIQGLTTAAGVWATAAIGLAVGSGLYLVSIVATVFVLFGLIVLRQVARLLVRRIDTILITSEQSEGVITTIRTTLVRAGIKIDHMTIQRVEDQSNLMELEVFCRLRQPVEIGPLTDELVQISAVRGVEFASSNAGRE